VGAVIRLISLAALTLAVVAPAAAAAPLRAQASFDAATAQFGAPIHARVSVVADPSVRRSSVRVVEDLAPLTTVSRQRVRRAGNVIEATRVVTCVTAPCVAASGVARPKLAPAVVTAVLTNGHTVRIAASWPSLAVRGRVSGADLRLTQPPFRAPVAPPPPTYRIAPGTLAWLLDAAAIVLGLAALTLLAVQMRRWHRRRRRGARTDELERALRLAREAETRPPPDRRRAAGLLARLLDERHAPLAGNASELAWAEPPPPHGALDSLVGDVERERPA
jgi:hypothetical protein